MKEELAYKDAIVSKVNFDRVNIEKEMETLRVRQRPVAVCSDCTGGTLITTAYCIT